VIVYYYIIMFFVLFSVLNLITYAIFVLSPAVLISSNTSHSRTLCSPSLSGFSGAGYDRYA